MSTFRDKLKATSTSTLKKSVQQEDAFLPSSSQSDFLKLEQGLNKVRIYPKHPDEEKYSHIKCSCWLAVESDEGKEVRRTFQNAKIHLGTKHDLIEEYVNSAKSKLSSSKDPEDITKLTNLTKYKEGNNASISYGTTWLVYADLHVKGKDSKFGLLELKKSVRDALNRESIIEDEDEAIDLDPFTDPDTGKPILITFDKNAKVAANYYKVQLSKNELPLTDEQIEKFEKTKPLSKLQQVKYTLKDFDTIIDGLRNYDDSYEIGVFETDSFQEMIDTCRAEVVLKLDSADTSNEEENDEQELPKKSTNKNPKKVVEEVDEDMEEEDDKVSTKIVDKFDKMDRSDLKSYNRDNGLGITVLSKMSDDELRDLIREKKSQPKTSNEEDDIEEEQDDDVVTPSLTPKKKTTSLEDLKKKLMKK